MCREVPDQKEETMTRYLVHPGTGTIIDLDDDCYYLDSNAASDYSDGSTLDEYDDILDQVESAGLPMSKILNLAGLQAPEQAQTHAILVGFHVRGATIFEAHQILMRALPGISAVHVESWWIAEDERWDNSDSDAAVFVPCGMTQAEALTLLDSTDWVIIGKAGEYDAWSDEDGWQSHAFWNNTEGWTTLKNATRYSTVEMHAFTLPQGAIGWIYTGKDGNK